MEHQKKYKDKYFYNILIILACVFGIFYSRYYRFSHDIPLHTLVSESLLFHDTTNDVSVIPKQAFTYPVYHFCQKIVHLLFKIDYETSAILCLVFSIIVSILLYRQLIRLIVKDTVRNYYMADFLSISAVLFGVARCALNDWRFYKFQCSPNPLHNPTILFVRPFAIGSFILFLLLIKYYKKEKMLIFSLAFSLVTLISVGVKPSYAVVFLPAMGIYTLYFMIKNKDIKFGIYNFSLVLPSLLLLVFQQLWMKKNTGMLNVSISFGGFTGLNPLQIIGASLVTFPTVILLFQICKINLPSYFIAIFALITGWLQMYFLSNGGSGDFSWGYDLAVQFSTIIVLAISWSEEQKNSKRLILNYSALLIFIYQIFTGIIYLWHIYLTNSFWI